MLIITGAAGFIGSCAVRKFNDLGRADLILADDFSRPDKASNLEKKAFEAKIHRDALPDWLLKNYRDVEAILHLGARTDTTEFSKAVFDRLNLDYSKALWAIAAERGLPFFYASSAATYGAGEQGYRDDEALLPLLKPLNPYGQSKHDFDRWALAQPVAPPAWAGFKFFNVYGPNESHKGRMASVVFHAANQIRATGKMRLFRSHRPDFADGQQSRDFVYVKDVLDVLLFFLEKRPQNGIFNLGTGRARSFLDLTKAVFASLGLPPQIEFIDTPADIRDSYQYFTEADMGKLRAAGYEQPFWGLEAGVEDYVSGFLGPGKVW